MSVRDRHPRLHGHRPLLHELIVDGCHVRHVSGSTLIVRSIDRDRREVLLIHPVRGEQPVSWPTLDLDYQLVGGSL